MTTKKKKGKQENGGEGTLQSCIIFFFLKESCHFALFKRKRSLLCFLRFFPLETNENCDQIFIVVLSNLLWKGKNSSLCRN